MACKIHINGKGEPGVCHAEHGGCPFGEHFDTKEEARAHYELEMSHKTLDVNKPSKIEKPSFSIDDEDFSFVLKKDENATEERKNKGEYSEIYVAHFFMNSPEKILTENGSKPLTIESMTLGKGNNKVDYIVDDGYFFMELSNVVDENGRKKIVSQKANSESSKDVYNAISKGRGAFGSPAIQTGCVSMGFTDGRVPKASSSVKADIVCWDDKGEQRRISVKSYIGSNPTLINASKSSQMFYETKLPEGMSEETALKILDEIKDIKSTKEKLKYLAREGIDFDPTLGKTESSVFKKNLDSISSNAEKAYAAAVFTAVSDKKIPKELTEDYGNVLQNFATKMTHTTIVSDDDSITDFAVVTPTGNVKIMNFDTEEKATKYFTPRVSFSEPAKGKFDSGVFEIKDGSIKLMINAFGSISEKPLTTKPISS